MNIFKKRPDANLWQQYRRKFKKSCCLQQIISTSPTCRYHLQPTIYAHQTGQKIKSRGHFLQLTPHGKPHVVTISGNVYACIQISSAGQSFNASIFRSNIACHTLSIFEAVDSSDAYRVANCSAWHLRGHFTIGRKLQPWSQGCVTQYWKCSLVKTHSGISY